MGMPSKEGMAFEPSFYQLAMFRGRRFEHLFIGTGHVKTSQYFAAVWRTSNLACEAPSCLVAAHMDAISPFLATGNIVYCSVDSHEGGTAVLSVGFRKIFW